MPRQAAKKFVEKDLNKGHLRKLQALRNSLGDNIADKAFGEWLSKQAQPPAGEPEDRNAILVAKALEPLAIGGKLKFPSSGYVVRRGRGRVIVERLKGE